MFQLEFIHRSQFTLLRSNFLPARGPQLLICAAVSVLEKRSLLLYITLLACMLAKQRFTAVCTVSATVCVFRLRCVATCGDMSQLSCLAIVTTDVVVGADMPSAQLLCAAMTVLSSSQ
jgi:hypothetical protein